MAFPFIHPQKLTATAPKRRVWKMKFLFKRRWFQVPAVTFLGEYSNTPYHPILSTGDATPAWYKAVFYRKNLPDKTQSKTKKTFHKKCPSHKKTFKKMKSHPFPSPFLPPRLWYRMNSGWPSWMRKPTTTSVGTDPPATLTPAPHHLGSPPLLRASGWKGFEGTWRIIPWLW